MADTLRTPAPGSLGRLLRIYLREQRWRTLGWTVMFAAFCIAVVRGFETAYPTAAGREQFARLVDEHGGFRLLNGLPYRLDTLGGFVPWRLSVLTVFSAAWALLATTRMLRGEEEAGRWEYLAAGRRSTRALLLTLVATALLGMLAICGGVIAAMTLVGMPLGGTLLFAAALLGPAAAWIGIAAVTSQLLATRRGAAIAAAALLGLALVARIVADAVELDWLRWATPLGWYDLVRPYTEQNALPLVLYALLAAGATLVAVLLVPSRDVGGATLEQHDPRRSRLVLLGSSWQLSLRATLRPLAAWALGLWGVAAVLGLLVEDVAAVLESSDGFRELFTKLVINTAALEQYVSIVLVFVTLVVSIFAAGQVAAMREEEASGRVDTLLGLPTSRTRWLVGSIAVSVMAITILLLGATFAIWVTATIRDTPVELRELMQAGIGWSSGAALFHAIGIALYGWLPRRAGGLAGAFVLASFTWWAVGNVMDVPAWTTTLVVFEQLPHVPAEPFDASPVAVALGLALLAYAIGWFGLQRRDIQPD